MDVWGQSPTGYFSYYPSARSPSSMDSIVSVFDAMVGTMTIEARAAVRVRRRRFQTGSLQKRKSGGSWHWIAFWWEDHRRRSQVLGLYSEMSRPEALVAMGKLLQPINAHAGDSLPPICTVGDWIRDTFLPFGRRKWKLSTASTTGDRIRKHLLADLATLEIRTITRDLLQQYLEQKLAQGLSFSVVDHLRWDLRAIFSLGHPRRPTPHQPRRDVIHAAPPGHSGTASSRSGASASNSRCPGSS